MKQQKYAPVYAAMYPDLAEIFKSCGYALAIHGSLQRDFDLIAIPWVENPQKQKNVLELVEKEFDINIVGEPEEKLHGRVAYTLSIGFGECAIDLSFMPIM